MEKIEKLLRIICGKLEDLGANDEKFGYPNAFSDLCVETEEIMNSWTDLMKSIRKKEKGYVDEACNNALSDVHSSIEPDCYPIVLMAFDEFSTPSKLEKELLSLMRSFTIPAGDRGAKRVVFVTEWSLAQSAESDLTLITRKILEGFSANTLLPITDDLAADYKVLPEFVIFVVSARSLVRIVERGGLFGSSYSAKFDSGALATLSSAYSLMSKSSQWQHRAFVIVQDFEAVPDDLASTVASRLFRELGVNQSHVKSLSRRCPFPLSKECSHHDCSHGLTDESLQTLYEVLRVMTLLP